MLPSSELLIGFFKIDVCMPALVRGRAFRKLFCSG